MTKQVTQFDAFMLPQLEGLRQAAENELWEAQLREYPDSRRVSLHEAFKWMDSTPKINREWWEKNEGCWYGVGEEVDRLRAWDKHVSDAINRHRLQMARGLALALQNSAFVIYECCRRPDGTYRYKGIRYGTEGSQYISGFPEGE